MATVDFYKVEVKYSGRFDDYTDRLFKEMALERMYHGVDGYEYSREMEEHEADAYDGRITIVHKYPCNKLVDVCWAEKREEGEE